MATAQTPAMADIHSGEHGHDQASPGEIAIGVIIGRTSEFFDFFVYAIASVIVFPKVFFPYLDPLNHVQVELLKKHRAELPEGEAADEQVLRGIQITINGISAGLRNSG